MAKAITDATFEQETKDGLVLVDFWATWCGPCRMQGPILDKLSEELSEDVLKIVKMDVDENPNTARAFGIMSIPTLLFKKDGQVVKQVAGVHTAEQTVSYTHLDVYKRQVWSRAPFSARFKSPTKRRKTADWRIAS